jgi:hypothetical protein
MNGWDELGRFLETDPRDVGCDEALNLLHVYVDLVLNDKTALEAAHRYPASPLTSWLAGPAPRTLRGYSSWPTGSPLLGMTGTTDERAATSD